MMRKLVFFFAFALVTTALAVLILAPATVNAQTTKRAGYCCCQATYPNDPNDPNDDTVNYSYIEAVYCVDQTYVNATHVCVEDAKCGVTQ